MIFKILSIAIVIGLIYWGYKRSKPITKISQPAPAYDSQYEIFRDMEPADHTLENPWVGFLQEDVRVQRTGPIGDFKGNDSKSGKAPLYFVQ
jgi:hypothetical protein